jgi:UDP-N-acetylmuramate dehydrogenase
MKSSLPIARLRTYFSNRLQENVVMANYTTAHVGGPVDALLPVNSTQELVDAVKILWDLDVPFILIGSGSNILVSDQGLQGMILLNRTRNIRIESRNEPFSVWAESGANFDRMARQVAFRGLSGLEWAASIPGTVGGAVYGNAGAFGSCMQNNLILAEILHRDHGKETWSLQQMDYQYRSSVLKSEHIPAIILSATLKVEQSTREEAQTKMEEHSAHRKTTQPSGPSLGSMFKNPQNDYAGRLIDAAGLKGHQVGGVEISPLRANFFINTGRASAQDYWHLIRETQQTVLDRFGVELELEIELLGEFKNNK